MEATVLGETRIQAEDEETPYALVARNGRAETTEVRVGAVALGARGFVVAAGPSLTPVMGLAAGPFGPGAIERVFRTVMAETRCAEKRE
jgi:hypothetical protein